MARDDEEFDDVDDDFDEFDDEDEEGGLSGFVVLLMGIVMLGAFASVVWIAYNQGEKRRGAETPYVAADPEPVKIETADAGAGADPSRPVYDSLNGREPEELEVVAQAPEEPVDRTADDPIGAIAAQASDGAAGVEDAVADRIAALEAADDVAVDTVEEAADAGTDALAAAANDIVGAGADAAEEVVETVKPRPQPATPAATVDTQDSGTISIPDPSAAASAAVAASNDPPEVPAPTATASRGLNALSGSHVVQVGAFKSTGEADQFWAGLSMRLGDYVGGKGRDVERADLGERGVFYRVRIGPFASSAEAGAYCAGLKERGQDCLVKKV
ncbi:MAG: SPOR domain-containing protein [Pseudomonadota bacterium]